LPELRHRPNAPAIGELDPASHELKPVVLAGREFLERRRFHENQLAPQHLGVLAPFDSRKAESHLSGSTHSSIFDLKASGLRVARLAPKPDPAYAKQVFRAVAKYLYPKHSANPVGSHDPAEHNAARDKRATATSSFALRVSRRCRDGCSLPRATQRAPRASPSRPDPAGRSHAPGHRVRFQARAGGPPRARARVPHR